MMAFAGAQFATIGPADALIRNLNASTWMDLISCGGHEAMTCRECGDSAGFCNGDCFWDTNFEECKDRYQGCFEDSNPRTLPLELARSSSMTPKMCIEQCSEKNYLYAGLQHYEFCFCGNDLPPVIRPESECNEPCLGDSSKMCGGLSRNSVYWTSSAAGKVCFDGNINSKEF